MQLIPMSDVSGHRGDSVALDKICNNHRATLPCSQLVSHANFNVEKTNNLDWAGQIEYLQFSLHLLAFCSH